VGAGGIHVETEWDEEGVWDVEQSEGGWGSAGNRIWSVKNELQLKFNVKKKEIEEEIRWKDFPCLWIFWINVVKKKSHSIKNNVHIQCNFQQNLNTILYRP
jgi:hypothetical protein